MTEEGTLSAKEVARELGTDARTFRKFMRATLAKEEQPGQGNRYAIEADELDDIRTAFKKWNGKSKPKTDEAPAEKPAKKGKKSKKPKVEELEEIDDPVDEDLTIDEDDVELVDLDDPDDDDLLDIEDEDLDDLDEL